MLTFEVNTYDINRINKILESHFISYETDTAGHYKIDKSDAWLFQSLLDQQGIDYRLM